MQIQVKPTGPSPAHVMIIGEAPGEEEERKGIPFVGPSGYCLDKMLEESGIPRSECWITNLCPWRPPRNDISLFFKKTVKTKSKVLSKEDQKRVELGIDPARFVPLRDKLVDPRVYSGYSYLTQEIAHVKPRVIITVGNTSLWALTGRWGITRWRGSMLYREGTPPIAILPTYHPAAVLREWAWRAITVHDLRRAAAIRDSGVWPKPGWNFLVRPSFELVIRILSELLSRLLGGERLRISFDFETRSGHIACLGLAWSLTDAICIPFMVRTNPAGYWSLEQEAAIVRLVHLVCTHRGVEIVGQNLLYDCQYSWRHWHFVPRVTQDTMILQHACWAAQPKALYFLASMYCKHYVYWKDEGKDFYDE